MLSPCELLTRETDFNRLCVACVQGQHPSSPQLLKDGLSSTLHWALCSVWASLLLGRFWVCCFGCFWFVFFFQPSNHLFVALRQNFIQNKWCKKRQWQPLVSVRIAKPSMWLTVNSSLPGLLAELIRLRVLKFFANLYMHRSEVQIDDGTAPCCHQVSFNSELLPDVISLPPALAELIWSSMAHGLALGAPGTALRN